MATGDARGDPLGSRWADWVEDEDLAATAAVSADQRPVVRRYSDWLVEAVVAELASPSHSRNPLDWGVTPVSYHEFIVVFPDPASLFFGTQSDELTRAVNKLTVNISVPEVAHLTTAVLPSRPMKSLLDVLWWLERGLRQRRRTRPLADPWQERRLVL
ncbi:hypothetical protein D1007_17445 [Hordeum vulgare]|nr:hypothetical protein D1007_17445 [Hordeum vulgare]